jgi:molecular chaperone GrpE
MRIPITISGRQEPLRREAEPLGVNARPSDEYGYPRRRAGSGFPEPLGGGRRTNLAPELRPDEEEDNDEDGRLRDDAPEESLESRDRDRQRVHPGAEDTNENWRDRYARLSADFDNYKRHAQAQKEQFSALGKEAVLEDVFPLVEHMERAIRAARDAQSGDGILQGLEMVYKELLALLDRHGVKRVETVGNPFNPEIHEAVAVTPGDHHPANTVVEEIRAGFVRNGKLLRPASVLVAK